MLNIILICRDIICVDINVDKRCVDHSTSSFIFSYLGQVLIQMQSFRESYCESCDILTFMNILLQNDKCLCH